MQGEGKFCDAGAPVVDAQGVLMAIGAPWEKNDGNYLTRLIDVGAVRAVLKDRRKQEQEQKSGVRD